MKKTLVGAICVGIVLAGSGAAFAAAAGTETVDVAAADGAMHVPDNYRLDYQYLGSWAVAADAGEGSKEMHTVYASPGAIETYRKTGKFADGTVLVKEVSETTTGSMTTGTVSMASHLKGWFVMVRDGAGKYRDNPLWGDGWGWAWFDAADPRRTTTTNYRNECQGCHIPAKSTDWIYVGGYPALKS